MLRVIIKAIQYCHNNDIVHRDLKPENIVYENNSDDSNIVIIDFGDSARIQDHNVYNEFVGTPYYLPPEIVRARHGWELKKSDMWTIGVIAYVLGRIYVFIAQKYIVCTCGKYIILCNSDRQTTI